MQLSECPAQRDPWPCPAPSAGRACLRRHGAMRIAACQRPPALSSHVPTGNGQRHTAVHSAHVPHGSSALLVRLYALHPPVNSTRRHRAHHKYTRRGWGSRYPCTLPYPGRPGRGAERRAAGGARAARHVPPGAAVPAGGSSAHGAQAGGPPAGGCVRADEKRCHRISSAYSGGCVTGKVTVLCVSIVLL